MASIPSVHHTTLRMQKQVYLLRFWVFIAVVTLVGCAGNDNEAPVMRLYGADSISLTRGSYFEDPGVVAFDKNDLDLKDKVVVTGVLDFNTIGDYERIYTATDEAGNSTQVRRMFHIYHNHHTADGRWNTYSTCNDCSNTGEVTIGVYELSWAKYMQISPALGTNNSSIMRFLVSPTGTLTFNQGSGCSHSILSAVGSITADGDSISLSLVVSRNNVPSLCDVTYVRQ